jgi:hypothetical protein
MKFMPSKEPKPEPPTYEEAPPSRDDEEKLVSGGA